MTLTERRARIRAIAEEAKEWRREMHRHPQTMYEETFASGLVVERLTDWGIPHETGFAGTGVVATIEGQAAEMGPVIAFRADMDALDIAEETGLPWSSIYPGKMHACGHDGILRRCWRWGNICRRRGGFRGRCGWCFSRRRRVGAELIG
jgi:metal-dependent amidase/aminoacylase/carboxypeptidase family protein